MLRSFSRAGRSIPALSLVQVSLRSPATSIASSLRQQRWNSSSPSPASSTSDATPTTATSSSSGVSSEAVDTPAVISSPPTPSSTSSHGSKASRPNRHSRAALPPIVRLPPNKEYFNWSSAQDTARHVHDQIKHDAKSPEDLRIRQGLSQRVGTSEGVHRARQGLAAAIQKVASMVLHAHDTLVVLGSVAQGTDINASVFSLGLLPGAANPAPTTLEGRQEVLKTLIEPLRDVQVQAVLEGENLVCSSLVGSSVILISLSYANRNTVTKNALYASYTSLSPSVLVPLIKSVSGIRLPKLSNLVEQEELRTILCISYLQSLPSPALLPVLQRPSLVRAFGVPRSSLRQISSNDGEETTKTVETTFVPIGVSPKVLEKTRWMNEQQEVEFVRKWRSLQAPPLGELVAGFFHWYGGGVPASTFSWATHGVSVRGLISREQLPQFAEDTMVVVDPLNPDVNLVAAHKTTEEQAPLIFQNCLRDTLLSQDTVDLQDLQPRPDFKPQARERSDYPKNQNSNRRAPAVKRPSASTSTTTAAEESPLVAAALTLEAAVPQEPEVKEETKPVEEK